MITNATDKDASLIAYSLRDRDSALELDSPYTPALAPFINRDKMSWQR